MFLSSANPTGPVQKTAVAAEMASQEGAARRIGAPKAHRADAGRVSPGFCSQSCRGARLYVCLQPADETDRDGQPFEQHVLHMTKMANQRGIGINWFRYAVNDMTAPSPELMGTILDCIDHGIAANEPVYVHCWGGHGRTATVIGCWLVRHGKTGREALQHIRQLRQLDAVLASEPAPQTAEQIAMVKDWSE